MQDTATPALPVQAGVWIDHRQAWIVELLSSGPQLSIVHSKVEKHPERAGDSPLKGPYEALQVPADDRRQRALTAALNVYYDAVAAILRRCGPVLIFGPGEAKGELRTRLHAIRLGDRIADVQTEAQMTEGEVVAKVREYFGLGAPRVQAPEHRHPKHRYLEDKGKR